MLIKNVFIRLPSIQSNDEADANSNDNRCLSPISVNSEEGRHLLSQVKYVFLYLSFLIKKFPNFLEKNYVFLKKCVFLKKTIFAKKNSLLQAFAAGQARISSQKSSNTPSSHSSSAVTVQNAQVSNNVDVDFDDSHSSISSTDSIDSNALLQQCIQVGMGKTNQIAQSKTQSQNHLSSRVAITNQTKKSQLPTPKASTSQPPVSSHRSRALRREEDEKQLLLDCINAGIERNIRSKSTIVEKSAPNSPLKRFDCDQSKNMPSKNAQTTSATVYHTAGATDVVKDKQRGTACAQDLHQLAVKLTRPTASTKKDHEQNIIVDTIETTALPIQTETGYNNSALNTSMMSTKSHNSFNMGGELSLLERSNEYPALLGQHESIYDSQHSSSVDMEVSNECLFENLSPPKMDKHKDPNLMLQSVERLTHELVSTAEYLRTANSIDDDITITESKITYSTSNNTWNDDDGNLNDVPFPKMSKTPPVIASMNDDDDTTISEFNGSRYEMANSEFIEDNDKTLLSDLISDKKGDEPRFQIGGIVNHMHSGQFGNGFDSHSTTSTMTNSTIIAMEANKIRSQLMKDNKTDSMISLDKVRPPSVMEKMNNSSYCESFNGASSLNRSPARFLNHGFMARRALQSNGNNSALGSTDSINSSCNLDKVKPPSIMDDLLDSMISVDSIASELVENPLPAPNEDPSQYETAFSECDDMTMTLKNCVDLPYDNTPCGSDFSSVESTPKKGRRSLTPRRKRQLTKERYQTYTISKNDPNAQHHSLDNMNDQVADGQGVFHMQISNHPLLMNGNDSDAISLVSSDGEMSSIRAFTRNLPYLNDISIHNDVSINTNTYTKLPRGSRQNSLQSTPMPSGDFFDSLPTDNASSNASSKAASPKRTPNKSPRIIKPNANAAVELPDTPAQLDNEPKAIRGRKKPAYVSPYSLAKLTKTSPPQPKVPVKTVAPKIEPAKTASVSKTVENKAKSFIQRSAESLKKIRPSFTTKLSRQTSKQTAGGSEEKSALDRQKSNDSTKSSETLIRQSTFIKDEPSEGEIPVIVSEPTSPKKTKASTSKIPFNRTTSLQARNVTKSNTNIEIPLQKTSTFIRRTIKSASSTSQISSASSKGSLSPRQSIESPSTSTKNLFNRWTPPNKKVSPLPANAAKIKAATLNREPPVGLAAAPKANAKVGVRLMATGSNTAAKASKIATSRPISTNGRTTKV